MKPLVLLVDDDDDARELLGRALERAGYDCALAADASAALAALKRSQAPDVVVLDVVLGAREQGGLELLTSLRAQGVTAPVIVITAYADVEKLKIALNEGARHFLEKPFSAQDLIQAIQRVRTEHAKPSPKLLLDRALLTEKEGIVARYLIEGLSSSQIAEREDNSPKTIRQHISQIYAKYGVSNRAEFLRRIYTRS